MKCHWAYQPHSRARSMPRHSWPPQKELNAIFVEFLFHVALTCLSYWPFAGLIFFSLLWFLGARIVFLVLLLFLFAYFWKRGKHKVEVNRRDWGMEKHNQIYCIFFQKQGKKRGERCFVTRIIWGSQLRVVNLWGKTRCSLWQSATPCTCPQCSLFSPSYKYGCITQPQRLKRDEDRTL